MLTISYEIDRFCFMCGEKFKVFKYLNNGQLEKFCKRQCFYNHRHELTLRSQQIRKDNKWKEVTK